MVQRHEIDGYAAEVARRFHPDRIILFGSYAEGSATQDSDVDLLVEMDCDTTPLRQAVAIRRAVKRGFPLDLVVKSPGEVRERLRQNDGFLKAVMANGQVLYARNR